MSTPEKTARTTSRCANSIKTEALLMTSIAEHFALVGDKFAADTPSRTGPQMLEGRKQVRLFQAGALAIRSGLT